MEKIFAKFDPNESDAKLIPNVAGNYLVCLRNTAKINTKGYKIIFLKHDDLWVLYTGISKNIRTRDYRQHFTGNNAGSSTLRKSIGVLKGYKLIPRDKGEPTNGKTKFNESDEIELSKWMRENLILFFLDNNDYDVFEDELINKYNPPLNLSKNKNFVNKEFREHLSFLRKNK